MNTLQEQIEALVAPTIMDMGFNLVQVKLLDGHKSRTLQVMAERPDGTMGVDDCARISNQLSALLDVEDVMPGEYRLEISSPGIDRPLRKEAEFAAYTGHLAKVETVLPIAGRKRFTGEIKSATAGALLLNVDGKDVAIAIVDIAAAKLVLTDALIKQHAKKPS